MLDLWNPWEIYDRLIEQIDPSVQVTASGRFGKWAFIENSEAGAGMAFHMPVESIARRLPADPSCMSLREVAAYAKSWNFAEAALGMAAVNSWYALPSRAEAAGFVPCQVNNWQNLFDPWSAEVAGNRVAVIGHFPFAAAALSAASELFIFERNVLDGDLPDTAAEYVLPTCDYDDAASFGAFPECTDDYCWPFGSRCDLADRVRREFADDLLDDRYCFLPARFGWPAPWGHVRGRSAYRVPRLVCVELLPHI